VEFLACNGSTSENKVEDVIKKTVDTKVEFENLKPFSVYGVSVIARTPYEEILCYYYQFTTNKSG
jgi:hypothetical protein